MSESAAVVYTKQLCRCRKGSVRIKVFYHDKCFDGACSAALFTRFYRERIREHAEFQYQGLVHRAGALFDEADFTGDENAIVDFKYSSSPRITWWFDHHQSAFLTPEDASHFEQEQSNTKFYDPDFRSCTKFIATVTEQRFGFDPRPLVDTIEWADIIDGALYDDAKSAVEMKAPASRLSRSPNQPCGVKGARSKRKRKISARPLCFCASIQAQVDRKSVV